MILTPLTLNVFVLTMFPNLYDLARALPAAKLTDNASLEYVMFCHVLF